MYMLLRTSIGDTSRPCRLQPSNQQYECSGILACDAVLCLRMTYTFCIYSHSELGHESAREDIPIVPWLLRAVPDVP
jgi:hypothetical protein